MKFLAALLLYASTAHAAFYPGTIALYKFDGNRTDATGNYADAVQTGTLGYVSSPSPPSGSSQWLSSTTTSNYPQAPSGLNTAMQSLTDWAIVMDIYYDGGSGNQSVYTQGPAGTFLFGFQDPGNTYMYTGGAPVMSSAGIVTTGAHQLVYSCAGGGTRYTWVDQILRANDSSPCTMPASIASQFIAGYLGGVAGLSHTYSGNYRFMTTTVSSSFQFPIVDTVDTPTVTPTFSDTRTITPTFSDTQTITPTDTPTVTVTATPTHTRTVTITITATRTPSPTSTITRTPSPTVTATATNTPACINLGQLTPLATPGSMWQLAIYKPVALTFSAKVCAVSVDVLAGSGKWWAALYDNNGATPHIVATSSVTSTSSTGFKTVPLSSRILPPGNYMLAVEMSDTLKLASGAPGRDSFLSIQWGSFPSLPTVRINYKDHSIWAFFCSY